MTILKANHVTIKDERTDEVLVDNISFQLAPKNCLGIVGESGSGKSLLVKGLLGLIPPWLQVSGSIAYQGMELVNASTKTLRRIRGKAICIILQDANAAFDPLYTIGKQISETLSQSLKITKQEAFRLGKSELERVGIREAAQVFKQYPHQLSGGMLQRCMIALAIAVKPDVIIADEPTTALDAITQKEIIIIFQSLLKQFNISVIFISHDLGMIQQIAQEVLVMKDGQLREMGTAESLFRQPQDPYTKYLLDTRNHLSKAFEQSLKEGTVHHA